MSMWTFFWGVISWGVKTGRPSKKKIQMCVIDGLESDCERAAEGTQCAVKASEEEDEVDRYYVLSHSEKRVTTLPDDRFGRGGRVVMAAMRQR